MKKKISNLSPVLSLTKKSILSLPSPSNISYAWNLGSLLGMNILIQIVSGLLVSMHYNPSQDNAFESVIHIMKEVNSGYLMKIIHANGASTFFIFLYIHICRGLLFSSFKKKETWISGVLIVFVLMGTAFLGYILPWGQMSFWGATVITNLMSAIPFVGGEIVQWLWGGFSVGNATLNRFYSLHYLFPFILAALILIHIMNLHESGSSNPLGLKSNLDKIQFHPFFSWKDILAPIVIFPIMLIILMKSPFLLGDPENFNPANPMSTPIHIQPEWYFLFAYAILRSIPNKLGGVIALVASIIILLILPLKKTLKTSSKFSPKKKLFFWMTASSFLMLTWGGSKVIETPFEEISKIFSIIYFISMILI